MVTKGIITAIDFKGNTCTVRMPFFETANNDPIVMNATFSNTPGMYNGYKVDDVVWVAFEDGQMEAPVILGKLYLGAEKEKSDPRGTVNTENVNASNTATIPADTKLKSNVGKEMPNTAHPYSSLSSVANDLNSLNKDVEYHNWYYENKIKNLTSVANGKSTTYYSDTDPSTDATITLYTGDTWFNTNPNKYFNIGPKEERKDYVGYWIINPDYDPADPGLPQYLEITEDNYNDIAELANLPDAYTRASLYEWYEGDKSWHEVDSEIVANKVTAAFVNALQITAKKIEVKNSDGDILFKANGLPDEPDTNTVQIANFNVDNNSLYIGTPGEEGSVLVSTGTTGIEHAITIETVGNYSFIKSAIQNIDGYTRFESTNQNKDDSYSIAKITALKNISLEIYVRSNAEYDDDDNDNAYDYLIVSTINAISYPTSHGDQYAYNSTYYDHFTADEEAEGWEETLNKYKKVTYTLNQNDYIYIVYTKDESVSVYPDTGYFLISNILLGDDFSIGNSPKRHGWAFTAGDGFGVTNDGNLYSNSGNIASWMIEPDKFYSEKKWSNAPATNDQIVFSPNYTLSYHPFYSALQNSESNWSLLISNNNGTGANRAGTFGITPDGTVFTTSLNVLGGSLSIGNIEDPNTLGTFNVDADGNIKIDGGAESFIGAETLQATNKLKAKTVFSDSVVITANINNLDDETDIDPADNTDFRLTKLVESGGGTICTISMNKKLLSWNSAERKFSIPVTILPAAPESFNINATVQYKALVRSGDIENSGGIHILGDDGDSYVIRTLTSRLMGTVEAGERTAVLTSKLPLDEDYGAPTNATVLSYSPETKTFGNTLSINFTPNRQWLSWDSNNYILTAEITASSVLPTTTPLKVQFTINGVHYEKRGSSGTTTTVESDYPIETAVSAFDVGTFTKRFTATISRRQVGASWENWWGDVEITGVKIAFETDTSFQSLLTKIYPMPTYPIMQSSIKENDANYTWVTQVKTHLVPAENESLSLGTGRHPWESLYVYHLNDRFPVTANTSVKIEYGTVHATAATYGVNNPIKVVFEGDIISATANFMGVSRQSSLGINWDDNILKISKAATDSEVDISYMAIVHI